MFKTFFISWVRANLEQKRSTKFSICRVLLMSPNKNLERRFNNIFRVIGVYLRFTYFIMCLKSVSSISSESQRCENISGRTLYKLLDLFASKLKKCLLIDLSVSFLSTRHQAISATWPWAKIMSRRIKLLRTLNAAMRTLSSESFKLKCNTIKFRFVLQNFWQLPKIYFWGPWFHSVREPFQKIGTMIENCALYIAVRSFL